MGEVNWQDVAPYVACERQSDEAGQARGERIADFLRSDRQCVHVEWVPRGVSQPGWNNGSCTKFYVYLDENWSPIPDGRYSPRRRYTVSIAVSERGPFVVSWGCEWLASRMPWENEEKLHPIENAEAQAKAKALALAVAQEFRLTHLDANWLRQFKLDEKDLTEDVLLSLDYSEPDALNVLFDEML